MKSAHDPRHQRRRLVVRELFANTFAEQEKSELAQIIWQQRDIIDKKITISAPAWPMDKLNKIDLAILRLAVYELSSTETPPKVIIDEAVELAKEFGSESSPSFINGVLGNVVERDHISTEDAQPQLNQEPV